MPPDNADGRGIACKTNTLENYNRDEGILSHHADSVSSADKLKHTTGCINSNQMASQEQKSVSA